MGCVGCGHSATQVDDILQGCFGELSREIDALTLAEAVQSLDALAATLPDPNADADRLLHQVTIACSRAQACLIIAVHPDAVLPAVSPC